MYGLSFRRSASEGSRSNRRRRFHSVVLIACAVFGGCSISPTFGQEIAIVVPNEFTDAEAPGAVGETLTDYIFQIVFDASQFSALPPAGGRLKTVSWRVDGDFEGPISYPTDRFDITASVTSITPDALSAVFADNITGSETVLVEGPITFQADGGPPGGPNPFTYRRDATNAFIYVPSEGNLLLEVTAVNAPAALFIDYLAENNPVSRQVSAGLDDQGNPPLEGFVNPGGVLELTFVPIPEPSAVLLAGLGMLITLNSPRASRRSVNNSGAISCSYESC